MRSGTLTERQQRVLDLEEQGKTHSEIGAELGISPSTVQNHSDSARAKLAGLQKRPGRHSVDERLPPEKVAEALDRLSDPFKRLEDVATDCGLPKAVIKGLVRRMRVKFGEVTAEMRAIKTKDMIVKIDERIHHALTYMDDYIMAEASFRDLAMGTAQLIEKRQLLKGEPTQIVSVEDRRAMTELVPLMLKEAQRRGYTLDGTATRLPDAIPGPQ